MRTNRLLAAAVTVLLAACSRGSEPSDTHPRSPTRPTTAATSGQSSPTSPTTPPTTGPTSTPPTTAPTTAPTSAPATTISPIPIPGLPEQGVAVDSGGAVELHDLFTGKLIERLPGFAIYNPTAAPEHLVLKQGGTYYLLEEFQRDLRPLASRREADRFAGRDQSGLDLPTPTSNGRPLTGQWRYQVTDPRYEDRVLAQWSGECEVPTAYFVDLDEGEPVPVTGEADPADAPESFAEGWTKRGQAVVMLPEGACGTGAAKPGVYLFRTPGDGRLVVRTKPGALAHMWGTAIAD